MAERFGVSPLSVAKRERGEGTPAIIQCREICVHYEISPDALAELPLSEQNTCVETNKGGIALAKVTPGEFFPEQ